MINIRIANAGRRTLTSRPHIILPDGSRINIYQPKLEAQRLQASYEFNRNQDNKTETK